MRQDDGTKAEKSANTTKRRRILFSLFVLVLLGSACGTSAVIETIANEPSTAPETGLTTSRTNAASSSDRTDSRNQNNPGPSDNEARPVLAYYWGTEWSLDLLITVLKRDVVVLFPDGRAATDTLALTDPNAVPSDKWGTYAVNGDGLIVDMGDYKNEYHLFDELANPGGTVTLNNCYSGNTALYGAFTFRSICFTSDGRFEKSTATAIDGPLATGTIIPPDSHGTYAIDGYRITLSFADGTEHDLAFGLIDEEQSQLIIGSQDYFDFDD